MGVWKKLMKYFEAVIEKPVLTSLYVLIALALIVFQP